MLIILSHKSSGRDLSLVTSYFCANPWSLCSFIVILCLCCIWLTSVGLLFYRIISSSNVIPRTMMCLLGVFSDYMFLCSKYVVISLLQVAMAQKVKVKVMWIYIALSRETTKGPFIATQLSSTRRRVELSCVATNGPWGAQAWITLLYLQTTPYLPLPRKRSPDGATTDLW